MKNNRIAAIIKKIQATNEPCIMPTTKVAGIKIIGVPRIGRRAVRKIISASKKDMGMENPKIQKRKKATSPSIKELKTTE